MTFKDKPNQMFNSEELHRIAGAAQNLSNTCYFEIGLLGLANDRYISQEVVAPASEVPAPQCLAQALYPA